MRLYDLLNPRVPWFVAVPCNVVGLVAIGLLILDPDANLPGAP
jgi:hypothetical protein